MRNKQDLVFASVMETMLLKELKLTYFTARISYGSYGNFLVAILCSKNVAKTQNHVSD